MTPKRGRKPKTPKTQGEKRPAEPPCHFGLEPPPYRQRPPTDYNGEPYDPQGDEDELRWDRED